MTERKRVYGTAVHNSLRHIATGVIDGTFAKTKGGWDTNTYCGQYVGAAVEEDDDLVVTCLRCLGRRPNTGSILRGRDDQIILDEAQDFTPTQMLDMINEVGQVVKAGATRRCVVGTPSTLPPPSDGGPPTSRRSR